MIEIEKWRIKLFDGDCQEYRDIVAAFERAYEANNKPEGMAMFDYTDTTGMLSGVSITPTSNPNCRFSEEWIEDDLIAFGKARWVAGDVSLNQN